MSLKYRNSQGVETHVAGLNGTSGELVPSVALMQSGTATLTVPVSTGVTKDVTFDTPMPDSNYIVTWDGAEPLPQEIGIKNKTANGFTIAVLGKTSGSSYTLTLKWTAFKLMTDTVHEADSAHIAQNTANFAPAFNETTSYAVGDYVTYNNVLYRCTTAHTAGAWDSTHFTQVTVGGELKSEALHSISGITISQQTATLQGCWMARFGKVVQLRLALSDASMTTASATTLKLTFPSSVPKPIMEVWGVNDHYNDTVDETAALRFTASGDMYIFTTKDHSPLANANVNIGIVYLTDE